VQLRLRRWTAAGAARQLGQPRDARSVKHRTTHPSAAAALQRCCGLLHPHAGMYLAAIHLPLVGRVYSQLLNAGWGPRNHATGIPSRHEAVSTLHNQGRRRMEAASASEKDKPRGGPGRMDRDSNRARITGIMIGAKILRFGRCCLLSPWPPASSGLLFARRASAQLINGEYDKLEDKNDNGDRSSHFCWVARKIGCGFRVRGDGSCSAGPSIGR